MVDGKFMPLLPPGSPHAKQRVMAKPSSRNPVAGGFFIAAGMLGGAVIGIFQGEPSLYMVAGLALGCAVALAIWLIDRRKG